MLLLIDNYDSFTYNLVHALGECGASVEVRRNDVLTVEEALNLKPSSIVLSPGPCGPLEAGVCLDLIDAAAKSHTPLLGVCLGHQSIGHAFGGKVVRAPTPVHGKTNAIHHKGHGLFQGIPDRFSATRYHSLIVDRDSLPKDLRITAETDEGLIMGLEHASLPLWGVQFHPESIATDHGHLLLKNFLSLSRNVS